MHTQLKGAILAGLLAMAGCARDQAPAVQPPSAAALDTASTNASLIITPEVGLNGKIASVNANLRFVVITFPVGQMPPLDRRLNVYRQGLKVGEVRISGPQSDDSIVADITSGEAAIGDAVRDK